MIDRNGTRQYRDTSVSGQDKETITLQSEHFQGRYRQFSVFPAWDNADKSRVSIAKSVRVWLDCWYANHGRTNAGRPWTRPRVQSHFPRLSLVVNNSGPCARPESIWRTHLLRCGPPSDYHICGWTIWAGSEESLWSSKVAHLSDRGLSTFRENSPALRVDQIPHS